MPSHRHWVDRNYGVTLSGSPVLIDLLSSVVADFPNKTVERLIIRLFSNPDSFTTTTSGVNRIDLGIGVVTADAFAVGITAVPDPRVVTDFPARGWLWKGVMFLSKSNAGGTESESYHYNDLLEADLRAMRKVDRGVLMMIAAQTAIQGSEVPLNIDGLVRTLLLTS